MADDRADGADAQTGTAKKIRPADDAVLPAIDCDVLRGRRAIAAWLGWTYGEARGLIDSGEIPTYRLRTMTFAFKSEILVAFREFARRPGATAKLPPRKQKTPRP